MELALLAVTSLAAIIATAWALLLRARLLEIRRSEPAESRSRTLQILDTVTDAFFHLDPEWRFTYLNPAAESWARRVGLDPDDILGEVIWDAVAVDPDNQGRQELTGAMEGGEAVHYTRFSPVLSRWVDVHAYPSEDGLAVYIRDVTEQKDAEEALRESEERYRALFESDVAGNYVIGADGVIRACNEAFARIFGFESAEEAVGTQVVPRLESQETRDAFLDELREHGSLRMRETEGRRLDGSTVYVTENVRGVFDDDGELVEVRGHMIDVTERRELEEQLRQAQKMEAVGQLAGGIAHDFNNLLTAVAGHADLLLIDDDTPDAVKDDVRRIKEAADRATSLTDQLLAFSRRQVLRSRVLDLNEVVRGMEEIMVRLLGEDIELDFDLDDMEPVRTDPNQVEQTLLNLAVNARDAMPDGGRIDVRTRNVSVDRETASRLVDLEPGPYALLEFSDTGEGMPEEIREKIFEPFFTTKEPGKGTGLGLAMVYGFVHQTGGSLQVESREGEGTRFRIYLPTGGEEAPTTAGAARQDLGGSETILLVDDEEAVRSLARKILEQNGYTVLAADHPRKALIHAEQWPEEVDLLLTDVAMPEMNGQALARRVLEHRPGIAILYITGHPDLDLDPDGPAGADGRLLAKPFSAEELLGRVRKTLDARDRVEAGRSP